MNQTLDDPRMSDAEIERISGGYTQPRRQLQELRAQGFWRARLGRDHRVILEREHYKAVCAGAVAPGTERVENLRPALRSISRTGSA